MIIDMYGDGNQAYQTQENYKAGKFCTTCNQMDSERCSRMILAVAVNTFKNEDAATKMAKVEVVLKKLSILIAGDVTGKTSTTCNKYNIGTSVPGM